MKKKIFSFLLGLLLVPSLAFGYTIQSGDTLSSIARQFDTTVEQLAVDNNISNPDLIYAGNELLVDEPTLGFSVVSRYKTNLESSMTSSQTTIPVSTLNTFDGHTLTMADLGDAVYLTIEPGSSREEIVKCTTISGSYWASCTRGLAFYGTSESSVSANKFAHNAGAIVVMSNVHYVYEQLTDKDSDETIGGIKTYSSFPQIATSTATPSSNGEFATKYYVDYVGAGGFTSSNIATNEGLKVFGTAPETAGVYVRADKGMVTSTTGIYQSVDTSTGVLGESASGITFSTSTLTDLIATSTPTASEIPLADSNGDLDPGWIPDGGLSVFYYTAGEAIDASSAPLAVYVNSSDGKIYKTDSGTATTTFTFIGFLKAGQNLSADDAGLVQQSGLVYNFSGLTAGSTYFVSTGGTVSDTAGTVSFIIGRSVSATSLVIDKQYPIQPGSTILATSADTQRTALTTDTTYTKVKEIVIGKTGTYTTSFDFQDSNGTGTAYARVYKNGSAVGTERSTSASSYSTYTENLSFQKGDLYQLYYKSDGSSTPRVANFRLYHNGENYNYAVIN